MEFIPTPSSKRSRFGLMQQNIHARKTDLGNANPLYWCAYLYQRSIFVINAINLAAEFLKAPTPPNAISTLAAPFLGLSAAFKTAEVRNLTERCQGPNMPGDHGWNPNP